MERAKDAGPALSSVLRFFGSPILRLPDSPSLRFLVSPVPHASLRPSDPRRFSSGGRFARRRTAGAARRVGADSGGSRPVARVLAGIGTAGHYRVPVGRAG